MRRPAARTAGASTARRARYRSSTAGRSPDGGTWTLPPLNGARRHADGTPMRMTSATPPSATPPSAAATSSVASISSLLPSREALLARVAEHVAAHAAPATLVVIGLLRSDTGWPTAQSTLSAVAGFLARSLRGDDWLAMSGPAEFVVLLTGPVTAAETAAARLVAAVPDLGIDGLTAAAGVAAVDRDVDATEVLRRGLVSLTAARRVGAGTVIRHREPY
jgi:GGDEF domain-containing protein